MWGDSEWEAVIRDGVGRGSEWAGIKSEFWFADLSIP